MIAAGRAGADDMADIKPQVYKDPRPAEYFARFHHYVRTHRPGWVYEAVRLLLTWIAVVVYRERAIGTENVPADGPAIIAPNHFSNMDHFFAGVYLRRKMQFMAKSQLFGNPILNYIFRIGGVFPVRRGHQDDEAFKTADAILERGSCVLMYCEGGRSRTGRLGEPRAGVGRLALESGVPVVPVAIHGSLGVRKWRKLRFPKVTVHYAEPISFDLVAEPTRDQQVEAAERIFAPVREMYAQLEEKGRAGVLRSRDRAASGAARYS
ncbi:MAG: lysophospholipid acyltransferase family protein [bacterium]